MCIRDRADTGGDPDEQVVRHNVGVVDIVDNVAPGGERILDAQAQEGQEMCIRDRCRRRQGRADREGLCCLGRAGAG